jgi:3',5'-cyclic AMP phosphodiesterase CpdA
MRHIACFVILTVFIGTFSNAQQKEKAFSFAFFTDIHLSLNPNRCFEGLAQAIAKAKELKVDFIITGGDNVNIDVAKNDTATIRQLFERFKFIVDNSDIKIYPAIGNHDRYKGEWKKDTMLDEGMYEHYLGKSYYSFNHKGWHFVILNTVQHIDSLGYPCINEQQVEWLTTDLAEKENQLPTIAVGHVPLVTTTYIVNGKRVSPDLTINGAEVLKLLKQHSFRLFLQGHKHVYEEVFSAGMQVINGGAISAAWWGGAFREGTEEGFVLINAYKDGTYDWEYIDYGWVIEKK